MLRIIKEIASWTAYILSAVAIGLAINTFVFQPTQIVGCSMESTFYENDKIMVNKLIHTFRSEPDYGDIVIIDSRVNRDRTIKDDLMDSLKYNAITSMFTKDKQDVLWIKRVIGKAGDILEYIDGTLYRNGEALQEDYIKEPMRYFPEGKVVVPEGCIYVMGDNRNASLDSRMIGAIPLDHVIGKFAFKFN
ncbi:MAG TPA: signal peptidase I [Acetivibrio clariflavus]|nr:signal peptidase I [Acetivibrio clariflavus]HPU41180.1 signal peptidase I [Acetivibrio clariflavus]